MKRHIGVIGGFLLGSGSAMTVEILKNPDPTSPIVVGVAVVEVVVGLALIALHWRG